MTARPGWKPTGNPLAPPDDEPVTHHLARELPTARNGLPPVKPYVYHGTDPARDAEVEQQLVSIRRHAARRREEQALQLTPAQWLDICEAIDGPDWEWYREAGDQP
jgi:hypothetical protein